VQQPLANVLRQHFLAPEAQLQPQPQALSAPPHPAAVPGSPRSERDATTLGRSGSSAEAYEALSPSAEPQSPVYSTAAPSVSVRPSAEPKRRPEGRGEHTHYFDRALLQQQRPGSAGVAEAVLDPAGKRRPYSESSEERPPDRGLDEASPAVSPAASESAEERSTPIAARSESVLLSTLV